MIVKKWTIKCDHDEYSGSCQARVTYDNCTRGWAINKAAKEGFVFKRNGKILCKYHAEHEPKGKP